MKKRQLNLIFKILIMLSFRPDKILVLKLFRNVFMFVLKMNLIWINNFFQSLINRNNYPYRI